MPVRQEDLEHLDKASVMRLTIATLKVRDMLDLCKCHLSLFLSLFPLSLSSSSRVQRPIMIIIIRIRRHRRQPIIFEMIINNLIIIIFRFLLVSFSCVNAVKIDELDADATFDDFDKLFADDEENIVMKALDGFLIVLSTDGDIIYVSENIHDIIGIQQVINSIFRQIKDKNNAMSTVLRAARHCLVNK